MNENDYEHSGGADDSPEETAEPGAARMKLPNKQFPWAIGEDGEPEYYDPEFLPD